MKIDWKRKLSSRKFWALLGGVVIAGFALFGGSPDTAERAVALLSAVGLCAVYILGEAKVDAANQVVEVVTEAEIEAEE